MPKRCWDTYCYTSSITKKILVFGWFDVKTRVTKRNVTVVLSFQTNVKRCSVLDPKRREYKAFYL